MFDFLSGLLSRIRNGSEHSVADARQESSNNLDERLYYRAEDGVTDIYFYFRNCGTNGWRAYILSDLDYGTRDSSAAVSHRLYDGELGLQYVCWSTPIPTKDQCKAVAKLWSEKTLDYIRKGTPIS